MYLSGIGIGLTRNPVTAYYAVAAGTIQIIIVLLLIEPSATRITRTATTASVFVVQVCKDKVNVNTLCLAQCRSLCIFALSATLYLHDRRREPHIGPLGTTFEHSVHGAQHHFAGPLAHHAYQVGKSVGHHRRYMGIRTAHGLFHIAGTVGHHVYLG